VTTAQLIIGYLSLVAMALGAAGMLLRGHARIARVRSRAPAGAWVDAARPVGALRAASASAELAVQQLVAHTAPSESDRDERTEPEAPKHNNKLRWLSAQRNV
jgi:hypothetical protein